MLKGRAVATSWDEALSQAVAAGFVDRDACLLANHGLVAGDAQGLMFFGYADNQWSEPVRVAGVRTSVGSILDAGNGWVWAVGGDGRIWRTDVRGGWQPGAPSGWG